MKKVFFTSDWHIGHQNVLKFDERPFQDLKHMHRVLINNYNSTVPWDGICYFLGDMGLTKSSELKAVVKQLHGTKVLIMGNHDKGVNAMYTVGFDVVVQGMTLYIANKRVTLSHCPLFGVWREDTSKMERTTPGENWHGESRYKHQRLTFNDEGQFHLHGHIHSRPGREEVNTKILGRQYDVGVCANNFRPVSISEIESWISSFNKNIPS